MKSQYLRALLALMCAVWIVGCTDGAKSRSGSSASGAASPLTPKAAAGAKNECLECHPFDEVIAASAGYTAPGGEKTNPHRYVPHNSKLEQDIPKCLQCHTGHSTIMLPKKGSIDLSKVNIEWCYTCHHERNLKSCKECHP
jgi:hypothetical protein